jgi:ubiquitin carboxyl-terminal hydrolase 10
MDPKQQFGGWAIWSRRPTNPSLAPGIIISPRSRPPQDVLEKALRISTPPESPKPAIIDLPATPPYVIAPDLLSTQATLDEPQKLASDPAESPRNDLPETMSSTETEVSAVSDTPPVPTSPLSSSTSVSAPDTAYSQVKSVSESGERAAGIGASIVIQESTPADVPEPSAALPSLSLDPTVITPEPVSSSVAPVFTPASTSAPTPASAPPVLKKSWASLLRPTAGETGSASKSSLPTSSVVGFSIPASPPPSLVPPVRRAELIALLSGTPPSRPTNQFMPRLRARGLVNSGNMCFANAVLQLLVYCPPFWKLFRELGRLMGPRDRGEGQGTDGSVTLLVDATVRFLEEFVSEEKMPLPTQQSPQRTGNVNAKKEEGDEKKEGDGVDSFIPMYVYDAMKEKKRFDHMRVRPHPM